MEKDWLVKITYLESVNSTQLYLKELVKNNNIKLPHAIVSNMQTSGVGSRDNAWKGIEGNLFLSFAISLDNLPNDLKLESSSIYFSYLLKEILSEMGSNVWLKWPNDFFIRDLKVGGMITNVIEDTLVCGVGLNLVNSPADFAILDVEISKDKLLKKYFNNIEKKILWKQVFSKYKLEFHHNKNFFTHSNSLKISLKDVSLQSDGSILSNGKRIYSLR